MLVVACGGRPDVLTFSGSVVGDEGALIRRQIDRFAAAHPGLTVEVRATPDAADARHQLYVQWLNAWAADPDVLQLDVVWTPEFAAAGWIRPFDTSPDGRGEAGAIVPEHFFDAAIAANRWQDRLFAVPWFVDVGMLYWRTDLMSGPPERFDVLVDVAARAQAGGVPYGLVWQGARYEGLVTVFLEHLAGFGGRILDEAGRVVVDDPAAVRALAFMRETVRTGVVPRAALAWHEEETRFAFQNGEAVFLRNWPYAAALMSDPQDSPVAGRFGVSVMPHATGGQSAAALGGAALAVNARSRQPDAAMALVRYLTAPGQMLERARVLGQFPARTALYDDPVLESALPVSPARARTIIEHAVPRPATPVYAELSSVLQVHLHRALTDQETPAHALALAADGIRTVLARAGLDGAPR